MNNAKMNDYANTGVAVVQETITGMGKIAERVKQTAATIDALGTRSEQIGGGSPARRSVESIAGPGRQIQGRLRCGI